MLILVTRPQPQADETADILKRLGHDAIVAPLTEYEHLPAMLPDLVKYQALVFTSAAAVKIFSERAHERYLPAFCVGEATAKAAADAAFQSVHSADGDAATAVELIRSKKDLLQINKILHVCGEDTARDLKPLLSDCGVGLDTIAVYKAKFTNGLPPDAARALKEGRVDVALLFSARTAAQLVRILQDNAFSGLSKNMEAVCISPRVAAALDPLPWKSVRTAKAPRLDSMLEILRVPAQASGAILDNGPIAKEASMTESPNKDVPERRVRPAAPDDTGIVRAEGYTGPDRRAYQERKKQNVRKLKMAFINRTTLSAGFLTAAVLYAVYFLLAPEIVEWDANAARVKQMQAQMADMNRQMDEMRKEKEKSASVGSTLNHAIEQTQAVVSGAAQAVADAATTVATGAASAPAQSGTAENLIRLLSDVQALGRTPEGSAALLASLARLKTALSLAGKGQTDINSAVTMAKMQDPTLNRLLSDITPANFGGAALLLAVNELRSHIDSQQPFADDLALVLRLSDSQPTLRAALEKLIPYAETGIASQNALEDEFKGLAGDIVMAKLTGQDASLKDEALQRLSKLVKIRKTDDIQGDSVDAVVARTQVMLDKGDVTDARNTLATLQGPPAAVAAPWLQKADGYVAATSTSDILSQTILQVLSSQTSGGGFSLDGMVDTLKDNLAKSDAPPDTGTSTPYLSPAMQNNGPSQEIVPYQQQ